MTGSLEYQYLSTYSILATFFMYFNVNQHNKILYESRIPNPNVTWEVANQSNIGFESMLFNKLTFEADYFYNLRKTSSGRRMPLYLHRQD